jgi:hypothetical protein
MASFNKGKYIDPKPLIFCLKKKIGFWKKQFMLRRKYVQYVFLDIANLQLKLIINNIEKEKKNI